MDSSTEYRPDHGLSRPVTSTSALSHHRCTPTARKPLRHHTFTSSQNLFIFFFLFVCCIPFTSATPSIHFSEELVEVQARTEALGSTLARLARSGTILVDQRPPPVPELWIQEQGTNKDLRRREVNSTLSTSTRSGSSISTKAPASSKSTLAPTPTSSGIAAAAPLAASAMPTPFDMGFSGNLSTSCDSFMKYMLANESFHSCQPFSLLLQNSNSFFQASKSFVRITQTLDTSCAANVTLCTSLLSSFATNLTSPSSCSADLSASNPLIQQTLIGLQAYKPLYTASCLRNPSSSAYCFADAITNATNPTDSYIYFLPLNISLVGGSQPTCDACLRDTMGVFAAASSDRKGALASTYVNAAMQVNVNCGPGFVNASLAQAVNAGSRSGSSPSGMLGVVALLTMVVGWLL